MVYTSGWFIKVAGGGSITTVAKANSCPVHSCNLPAVVLLIRVANGRGLSYDIKYFKNYIFIT